MHKRADARLCIDKTAPVLIYNYSKIIPGTVNGIFVIDSRTLCIGGKIFRKVLRDEESEAAAEEELTIMVLIVMLHQTYMHKSEAVNPRFYMYMTFLRYRYIKSRYHSSMHQGKEK